MNGGSGFIHAMLGELRLLEGLACIEFQVASNDWDLSPYHISNLTSVINLELSICYFCA